MKSFLLFFIILIASIATKRTFAQTELGLSRESIMNLPWVLEYHEKNKYFPAFEYEFMRVTSDSYHYVFGFSNMGICKSLTLESRSRESDFSLRDYLRDNVFELSSSTYIINPNDKKKLHYAFIIATHDGLPHHVTFSYKQMFYTDAPSKIDESPYEIRN